MRQTPNQNSKKASSSVQVTDQTSVLYNYLLPISLILSFIISFTLYLLTMAPTVTFEDSGELITAAYNLGVPHQPGYPLFTLLGRIFSFIPVNAVAFRLNLMSAFFASLGATWITWAVILMIEESAIKKNKPKDKRNDALRIFKYACALAAGIWVATGYEYWEQSIITEVYGLHSMFVGLLVLLAVAWKRQKKQSERVRYFLLICFVLGLSLSNHTTTLMFFPILLGFGFLEDRKFFLNPKLWGGGIASLLIGLLPYLYLPISSAKNPIIDWGNPETFDNFVRTISRKQFLLDEEQTLTKFFEQFGTYLEFLTQQWVPLFLLLAAIGLIALFKWQKTYFYLSLLFLFFSAPVTTYVTNFDVTGSNAFVISENKTLVSVFYIPSYMYIGLLMGLGVYFALSYLKIKRRTAYLIGLLVVMLPLGFSFTNYQKVDMSRYHFAEDYVHNLFAVLNKDAVVFANWDPYYFPLNYAQYVEGKRPDVIAIDQQLLRRSWYIQWLKDHYPVFVKPASAEVEAFLKAVEPFEEGRPYDGNFIQMNYVAMINAFIDRSIEAGRDVYLTYNPPAGVAQSYTREPVLVATKLKKKDQPLTPVDADELKFRYLIDDEMQSKRLVKVFRSYYGSLFLGRAQLYEKEGNLDQAALLYERAAEFMRHQPQLVSRINKALSRIQQQMESRTQSNSP